MSLLEILAVLPVKRKKRVLIADKVWNAAKNPLEAGKWFSEGQSVTRYLELTDSVFVMPRALLYHRYGAPHFSELLLRMMYLSSYAPHPCEMLKQIGAGAVDVLAELVGSITQVSRDRALGDFAVFLADIPVARRLRQEYPAIAVVEVEERLAEMQQKRLSAA